MTTKYKRYNIPGHAHELTFSCYKRQQFLKGDKIKNLLVESIVNGSETHNYAVLAYVIMPEHLHLMIYPRDEKYSISGILKSIKISVSRRVLIRLRELNSPHLKKMETRLKSPKYRFWQDGGGYDRNYFSPDEIRKQIDYIHKNPIRRGFVENAEDYRWSSAGFWLRGEEGVIAIDVTDFPVL